MESNLPTRPTSDLRLRLKGRNRHPAAIQTQHHAWPGPGLRHHNRSSSLSSISHSLSQLLPKNRKERGGTVRQIDDDSEQGIDTLPAELIETPRKSKQYDEIDSSMELTRRTQSESPKKMSRIPFDKDNSPASTGKLRMPGGWKRLWELHNTARQEDEKNGISQHTESPNCHDKGMEDRTQSRAITDLAARDNLARKFASHIPTSPTAVESPPSVSLRMYQDKRARREQRRSFRGSDDFLGVQGANPRTGFPDPSTATSSSTGDAISEPTRQKLEEDGRVVESARREYQAALERREREMRQLEMERERRRKDKRERAEKKRIELRAKIRREGRWRSEGNQWKMVAEPLLSPIVQSTAGSPTRENAAGQRPRAPSGVNRSHVPEILTPVKNDYFSPAGLPASIPRRFHKPSLGSAPNSPLPTKYKQPDVHSSPSTPHSFKYQSSYESTTSKHHEPMVPSSVRWQSNSHKKPHLETVGHGPLPIRLKDVGPQTRPRRASSAETVIHTTVDSEVGLIELPDNPKTASPPPQSFIIPGLNVTTPGETTLDLSKCSPDVIEESFLDMHPHPTPHKEQPKNEAIVTSSQSYSMSQVPSLLLLPQSPVDIFQAKCIISLDESPPMGLKNLPIAGLPSNHLLQRLPSLEAMKTTPPGPPPLKLHSQASTITISTITTTGVDPPSPVDNQIASDDTKDGQLKIWSITPSSKTAPLVNCQMKGQSNGMQNKTCQMSTAGTVTSLEAPLSTPSTPTKRPIPRLCQPASLKVGKDMPKSILISTSMSPQQSPLKRQTTGQKTMRVAFSAASPQKLGGAVRARSMSLISPKSRTQTSREGRDRGRKIFSGGDEGTGNLLQSQDELRTNSELIRKRIVQAEVAGRPSRNGEEGFVVWSTETEDRDGNKPSSLTKEKALPSEAGNSAGADEDIPQISFLEKACGVAKELVQTAWWFVSPVFNPQSGLRWRWVRNELTWQDIFLIGAAGIFGGGAFLIVVLCARILGVGLQIVRVFIVFCKFLVGL